MNDRRIDLPSVPEPIARRARLSGQSEWLFRLPLILKELCDRWHLVVNEVFDAGSEAFVVGVVREDGNSAVVKIAPPRRESEVAREVEALRCANPAGCVRVLNVDSETGAILMERLGDPLDLAGISPRERDVALAATAARFWNTVSSPGLFTDVPSFGKLLHDRLPKLADKHRVACSSDSLRFGIDCLQRRLDNYDPNQCMLVHGDLHDANALSSSDGYKMIDPFGIWAEPEFDLGIIMRLSPSSVDVDSEKDRARTLAKSTGCDEIAIWDWGIIQRLSNGLFALNGGFDDWGTAQLGAVELLSRTVRRGWLDN